MTLLDEQGRLLKTCKGCDTPKVLDDFSPHPTTKGGRNNQCKTCKAAASSRWRKADPQRFKASLVRYWFGVEFDELWDKQKGLCAVCDEPMGRSGHGSNSVAVDHDRSCCSGKKSCGKCVRGLVHSGCNLVLGHSKESPDRLRKAAEYLERFRRPEN